MACAHPWLMLNPNYQKSKALGLPFGNKRYYEIPCGWCLNCRVDKRNFYEDMCDAEYKKFGYGAFVTFTYDNYHIVDNMVIDVHDNAVATLKKSDLQDFLKRVRRYLDYHKLYNSTSIRRDFKMFGVGEYGCEGQAFDRPHFHVLFFGLDFSVCKKVFYQCWKNGIIDSLPIQAGGIRYVLKYMDKQLHGKEAEMKYDRNHLERPFQVHSQNLGMDFLLSQMDYLQNNNFCYLGRHKLRRPLSNYLRNKFKFRMLPELDNIKRQMRNYGVKPLDNKNYYSLTEINDFRHRQALLRERSLSQDMVMHGIPTYTLPPITTSFDEIDWCELQPNNLAV